MVSTITSSGPTVGGKPYPGFDPAEVTPDAKFQTVFVALWPTDPLTSLSFKVVVPLNNVVEGASNIPSVSGGVICHNLWSGRLIFALPLH